MILQALNDYYFRLQAEGAADLATEGFQRQPIPFVIVLTHEGRLAGLLDTRTGDGKSRRSRVFTVPKGAKKTSGIAANLLWDTPAYVLGRPKPDSRDNLDGLAKRALEQRRSFVSLIRDKLASALEDPGVRAVLQFLEGECWREILENPAWAEIEQSGANLSFQLSGDRCLVCERPAVRNALAAASESTGSAPQACMITGADDEPARLHTAIKGVYGAQTSGANIVSFNLAAFNSYGKQQSLNAPVGKHAEFAYTTALNTLLARGSGQRLQVGDSTAAFWTEKAHPIESVFADLFGEQAGGEPEQDYRQLVASFRAPFTGIQLQFDPETRFFVLGLAPNAARIAVRFWYAGSVREVAENIERYFEDVEIVRGPKQPRYPSLFRLMVAIAVQGKAENIPPNLAAEFIKSILAGAPFPQVLLGAAVRRCRAERDVSYPRASLIKAVLARTARWRKRPAKEVGMSLEISNMNIGYRLGRLFAALEKIQEEANPGINSTIRDRFYGSASATPVTAFPHLMKLKNYHLAKLENRGRVINLERLIGEIVDGVSDFPSQLSMPDQGRFAVGYYHQRQAFFAGSDKAN